MLENRIDKRILKERLHNETFKRRTLSFYKYFNIENPHEFRNDLYKNLEALNCFGRIYVAREGINAQMSIPEQNLKEFLLQLNSISGLAAMPIKYALVDNGKSFYKLTLKVRPKIVADGLDHDTYDLSKVGKHLSALEFHELAGNPEVVVIDMRNHYESEIGRFENAVCPDADTFKDAIQMVIRDFEFINTPPISRINPMKFVWEVRRDSGLDYDKNDPAQKVLILQLQNTYSTPNPSAP